MGFKGTPAPWYIDYDYSDNSPYEWYNIVTEENGNILQRRYSDKNFTVEQIKANALLISKAPEMLEMLIEIRSQIEDGRTYITKEDIDRLIKESTEL